MKILFSVFRYHTNMFSMVMSLKNAGHDVLILAVAKEPYEHKQDNLLQLIDLSSSVDVQIENIFEKFAADLVIVRDALNENVAPVVAKVSKERKIKCISYEQNRCYANSFFGAIYVGMRHFLNQRRRGMPLLEISPKRGALSEFVIPFRKYSHFPMICEPSVEPRSYFPDGIIRIVTVGKLGVERKRLHWVIRALESFDIDYQLTIVGANDLDRYSNRSVSYYHMLYDLSRTGLREGRIRILENLPFEQMGNIYQNSDIFVLASKGEKFGISPLEAMSHGCAVLTADDNGSSPYLSSGVDSLIFNSESFDDFYRKFFELLTNNELVTSLGLMAIKTIVQRHDVKSFESFISDLVGDEV